MYRRWEGRFSWFSISVIPIAWKKFKTWYHRPTMSPEAHLLWDWPPLWTLLHRWLFASLKIEIWRKGAPFPLHRAGCWGAPSNNKESNTTWSNFDAFPALRSRIRTRSYSYYGAQKFLNALEFRPDHVRTSCKSFELFALRHTTSF